MKTELRMVNQAHARKGGMKKVRKLRVFLIRSLSTLDQDSNAQLLPGSIILNVFVQTTIPHNVGWE